MSTRKAQAPLPLVFQHIPKTAGVSVRSVMASNFELEDILHVPDSRWRDDAFAAGAVRRYRFIHGHLHFEFVKGLFRKARVVTFVRDPVERVLSLYYFLRRQDPASYQDPTVRFTVEQARSLAPDRFVALRHPIIGPMVSDYQARVLLGADEQDPPKRNWLPRVLANLERYAYVGVCDPDLMAESVRGLTRHFGWMASGDAPLVNQTARPEATEEVERARRIIESRNRVDAAIVEHVRAALVRAGGRDAGSDPAEAAALAQQRQAYRTGVEASNGMARPLRCWGWHDRESDAAGHCWRCAAQMRAGLELRMPEGDAFVVLFDLISAHPRVSVPATVVRAAGRVVPSHALIVNNRWVIAAGIERRDVDAGGLANLELEFQEGGPAQEEPADPDTRFVTVALESIEVVSAQRIGRQSFDLLLRGLLPAAAVGPEDGAGSVPRRVWDPLQVIEGLRRDVGTLQAAREREAAEGERYRAALEERAQRAEALARSAREDLDRSDKALQELRAAHERQIEEGRAGVAQIAGLSARIEEGRAAYQALAGALERERAEARAYQASLVERAERSEAYGASLRAELDRQAARAGDADRALAEQEARLSELAGVARGREEALGALTGTIESERAQARAYQTSLLERAEHSESYATSLKAELDRQAARADDAGRALAEKDARLSELAGAAREREEALGALTGKVESERAQARAYQASLLERAERSETYATSLKAELDRQAARAENAGKELAESEARLSELARFAAEHEEALAALSAKAESERAQARQYQDSLLDRAARAESYAGTLRAALSDAEAALAQLEGARQRELENSRAYQESLVERAERAEAYSRSLEEALARARVPEPMTPQGDARPADDADRPAGGAGDP